MEYKEEDWPYTEPLFSVDTSIKCIRDQIKFELNELLKKEVFSKIDTGEIQVNDFNKIIEISNNVLFKYTRNIDKNKFIFSTFNVILVPDEDGIRIQISPNAFVEGGIQYLN